jgi:hypothetical protein
MLRKRYTVVIVGHAGSSAAQRSEMSRHRSERDATLAAEDERERLGGLHGDRTGQYRVVVECEGVIVPTPSEILDAERTTTIPRVPSGDDHAPIAPSGGTAARSRSEGVRRTGQLDIPDGPVPEDVLRRFEQAIAKEDAKRSPPVIEQSSEEVD